MIDKQDTIRRQIKLIRKQGVGASAEINPFWRDLLVDFERVLGEKKKPGPRRIQKALGYAQRALPEGVASNRDLPNWPGLQAVIDSGSRVAADDAEHAAQLHFLQRRGVLDEYINWADDESIVSDLGAGRQYWYAHKLKRQLRKLKRGGPLNMLEVGTGSGRFPMLMMQSGLVRHYVLVDLPEMLLNAMITLRLRFPEIEARLDEAPDFSSPSPTFWFCNTARIRRVAKVSVDVALNFNSLMEMDEEVRDFYLAEFYRVLKPGGLFYNVNRRQRQMTRRDGTPFESNPLFYPYRSDDTLVEWEPDECQESCRSQELISPNGSFSISRMSLKADPAD